MARVDNSMIEMTPLMTPTRRNDEQKAPINGVEESFSSDMNKNSHIENNQR